MEQKPVKTTTIKNPDLRADGNYSGGAFGPDKQLRKEINSAAQKDMAAARIDPKLNPAGKAKFQATADSRRSLGGYGTDRITDVDTTYRPDPAHAARRRGNRVRSWDDKAKGM